MRNRVCSLSAASVLIYAFCLLYGASINASEMVRASRPEFSMRSLSGEVIRLSEHRGSVIMLGFWARWCGDSRLAMQAMESIDDKYQRAGLITLGINVGDSAEQTAIMTKSLGLRFPILLDTSSSAGKAFNLESMPLIVLLDRDGELRYSHQGFQSGDEVEFAAQLHKLLNE